MTMGEFSQITGGTIRFLKRVRTGEYEHEEATAELTFSVGDGQDHVRQLDIAAGEADRKVRELLKGMAKRPAGRPPKVAGAAVISTETSDPALEATQKALGTTPDPFEEPASPSGQSTAPTNDVKSAEATSGQPQDTTTTVGDDWTAETPPITDKMLADACAKRNAEIANPPAIRKLIGLFVTAPKGTRDIPANQRQNFLNRLGELPKGTTAA
jgi:hypothetical protein